MRDAIFWLFKEKKVNQSFYHITDLLSIRKIANKVWGDFSAETRLLSGFYASA